MQRCKGMSSLHLHSDNSRMLKLKKQREALLMRLEEGAMELFPEEHYRIIELQQLSDSMELTKEQKPSF